MSPPGARPPSDEIGVLSPGPLSAPIQPPSVPDYELLQRLASGAYGEVWLARNKATGVLRAAKIVWRHTFEDDRPFQREFDGIQKFERISRQHPSQLALFHIGRNQAEGYFYYVMELADLLEDQTVEKKTVNDNTNGSMLLTPRTLRADLAHGRLPADRVLEIGLVLAEALANLHSHGLVHRDVKPSNVIFVNGRPKLADIGLVTDAGETRSIVGTEGYLAPEGPGSPQADLFALGKVLYEAMTGMDRRRFPRLPADLRSWPGAELVLELNEIVVKACATRLEERYRRAEDVRADLQMLKAGRSVKRLRQVEHRLSILTRAAVIVGLCFVAAAGIFYETYRQQQVALRSLVRLHVANGAHLLNEGDLFGSLLSFTEALRLDAGNSLREEGHRIRIASVLRECPKLVGVFTHGTAPINDATFSPDSLRLLTASEDHTAQSWILATGERQFSLVHSGPVLSVKFSPDGQRIATTSSDNRVRLWNGLTGQPLTHAPIAHRAWNNGPCPVFSGDGLKLLTLQDARTVVIWNALTGEPIGKPLRHAENVVHFTFSPDGRNVLTVSEDRSARIWSASTGEMVCSFSHQGSINCGAFNTEGRLLATGGDDNCARLWDLDAALQLVPPLIHRHSVDSVAFSPDSTRLVTACRDQTVELWDIATNQPLLRPLVHERKVFRTNFSPDARWIVTSSEGNRVRLWDADTGELRAPPLVHDTPRREVLFSPDGHLVLTLRHDLALEREEIAEVWDLARKEPPVLQIRPVPSFRQSTRSRDGRFKAVLSGDTISTIEVASGRAMTQPLKQAIPFCQAYFSGDDSVLLTESVGDRGQLWDLSRGEPLTPMLKTAYDRAAVVPKRSELQRDTRSVQDLVLLAELLSGNRVDETGGFHPVEATSLLRAWNYLRIKSPEQFADSPGETRAWHEHEARTCEQAWNWWSACFHLKWLLAARPEEEQLQHRLAYAELALKNADRRSSGYIDRRYLVIPPRDPYANPATIDLSSYYNLSRRAGDNSMASLPSGLQTFGGICFDVRGVVQLSDRDGVTGPTSLPKQVLNIPVNRNCHQLHLLQATAGNAIDKTEVSSYIIHYGDHRTECITNIYGRDVRSWWTELGESLTTERSALVWMGSNPRAQSENGRSLRMYKTSWKNPWPDVQVTTVDFVSSGKGVGPFLVAMTAK